MPLAFWDDSEAGYRGDDYQSNPHDTVFIGSKRAPGLVDIKIMRSRRVGKQTAKGRDGATKIVSGMEPAKVEITITIWTASQYRLLDDFTREFFPPDGKESRNSKGTTTAGTKKELAYDIRHPEADRMGVRSVVPFSMTSMVRGAKGERSITMTFEGHHQPPKGKIATGKVDGSKGGVDQKLAPPLDKAKQASFNTDAISAEAEDPGV